MTGYAIPKAYSTFPADDGGVFVVGDRGHADGRLTRHDAALILLASYDYEGAALLNRARNIVGLAKQTTLRRCLASDEIGEEPGWWDERGSGMALPVVYFPRSVVREL